MYTNTQLKAGVTNPTLTQVAHKVYTVNSSQGKQKIKRKDNKTMGKKGTLLLHTRKQAFDLTVPN